MNNDFTKEDINNLKHLLEIYKEMVEKKNPIFKRRTSQYKPQVSLHQTADQLTVIAKIPGIEKNYDVRIILDGNILRLSGFTYANKKTGHAVNPIPFSRIVTLPSNIKQGQATATYEKDTLKIRLSRDNNKAAYQYEVKVNFL